MLEIELKARVPELPAIRERLLLLHAVPDGSAEERDIYYNAPHRDFARTDEALRVRYSDATCTLTYKGPRRRDFALKAREEINCGVARGEAIEGIIQALGFSRVAEVKKSREYFRFRRATISLDRVEKLGTFIEVEVTDPSGIPDPAGYVAALAREIGAEGEPILASYLELLLEKQESAGI